MEKTIYKEFGLLGAAFRFMDEHKTLANIILAIEAAAFVWAVLSYDFTTRI